MAKQSEHLAAFYNAYLAWVDGGENPYNFQGGYGLCTNADLFDVKEHREHATAYVEMKAQFREAGMCVTYPFDNGKNDYFNMDDKRHNPKRIAWVRAHASKAEEGGK